MLNERVTVTVHGRLSAILIAPEDLEALEEIGDHARCRDDGPAGRVRRGACARRVLLVPAVDAPAGLADQAVTGAVTGADHVSCTDHR